MDTDLVALPARRQLDAARATLDSEGNSRGGHFDEHRLSPQHGRKAGGERERNSDRHFAVVRNSRWDFNGLPLLPHDKSPDSGFKVADSLQPSRTHNMISIEYTHLIVHIQPEYEDLDASYTEKPAIRTPITPLTAKARE